MTNPVDDLTTSPQGGQAVQNGLKPVPARAKDLTGQTFGDLRVLGYVGSVNGHGSWACRCICGNIKNLTQASLACRATSCGCLVSRKRKDSDEFFKHGITADLLRGIFEYISGRLFWKIKIATKVVIGSEAGSVNSAGYRIIRINKRDYLVHRLVWMMHNGDQPKIIDHINGDTLDNRIENLRKATHAQNIMNAGMWSNNKSGAKGVRFCKHAKKWIGEVKLSGKKHRTKGYDDMESCIAAVTELRQKLHKDFARQEIA